MEEVKDWSAFAADFEERAAFVVGKDVFDKTGKKLAEQENLGKTLELGCGPGTFTGILADKSDSVTTTDLSVDMVNAVSTRFCDRSEITAEQADCFNLDYDDSAFDTVFMANLLHIVPEPENALKEARRVLKPDGRIIVASLTSHGMRPIDKMSMGARYLKAWGKPPKGGVTLTVQNVSEMMENLGFIVVDGVLIGDRSKSVFVVGRKA